MNTRVLCMCTLLAAPITFTACGQEASGATGVGGSDDRYGAGTLGGAGASRAGGAGQAGGLGGFAVGVGGATNSGGGGGGIADNAGGAAGAPSDGGFICCAPDPVPSSCMMLGGTSTSGNCVRACDFFCSENWRIEKDAHGCDGWRYDTRPPRPGENSACFPLLDGSHESDGDGADDVLGPCVNMGRTMQIGQHWYAGDCQACKCTTQGAVCTERCTLGTDGGLNDVCDSSYHSRLVPGSPAKCPVCGPDSSKYVFQCDEQGLICEYEGSQFGARCTCGTSLPGDPRDAALASLVSNCVL